MIRFNHCPVCRTQLSVQNTIQDQNTKEMFIHCIRCGNIYDAVVGLTKARGKFSVPEKHTTKQEEKTPYLSRWHQDIKRNDNLERIKGLMKWD